MADTIRDRLAEEGVLLEDGPEGTQWQYQSRQ
jgi:cysteinyl-tRNA synthetase